MPHEQLHFVTGRLAEPSLRRVLADLAPRAGFSYTIEVLNITVAALMTADWVARRIHVPESATRVILPGLCQGDLRAVSEAVLTKHLYTNGIPDPDLILRTSGEERISNFLLWQLAYSELYFADVYWPGMRKIDFLRAIRSYQQRHRRMGS